MSYDLIMEKSAHHLKTNAFFHSNTQNSLYDIFIFHYKVVLELFVFAFKKVK
jgi:hypothetical protein